MRLLKNTMDSNGVQIPLFYFQYFWKYLMSWPIKYGLLGFFPSFFSELYQKTRCMKRNELNPWSALVCQPSCPGSGPGMSCYESAITRGKPSSCCKPSQYITLGKIILLDLDFLGYTWELNLYSLDLHKY